MNFLLNNTLGCLTSRPLDVAEARMERRRSFLRSADYDRATIFFV